MYIVQRYKSILPWFVNRTAYYTAVLAILWILYMAKTIYNRGNAAHTIICLTQIRGISINYDWK